MRTLRTCGQIPHHVAFVMDGNRRFARSQHIDKIEGHSRGFEKLADCLRWCLDVGVREVTTFAFSIENFKRSSEEVDGLFNLAREKFARLLQETARLEEHGIRIRVIGNIELLPLDLQKLVATAMLSTERNDKLFLNVAFAYTSRDEITQAVETVLRHGSEDIGAADISERLLQECLYTRHSPPPDLVFRTSGETRLSDFMMWQVSGRQDSGQIQIISILYSFLSSSAHRSYTSAMSCGPRSRSGTFWPAFWPTSATVGRWTTSGGRSECKASNWPRRATFTASGCRDSWPLSTRIGGNCSCEWRPPTKPVPPKSMFCDMSGK